MSRVEKTGVEQSIRLWVTTGDRPAREAQVAPSIRSAVEVSSPGVVPVLNGHHNPYNFKERRAKRANEGSRLGLNLTEEGTLPEMETDPSFLELGISELPKGVSIGVNGHFPLEELVNTTILRLVKVSEKEDEPSAEVTKLRKLAELEVAESPTRRLTRRFVEKQGLAYKQHTEQRKDDNGYWYPTKMSIRGTLGTATKRKDHHYAATDHTYRTNRDKAIETASRRRVLKAETAQEYLQALQDAEEENWESYLQINSSVIDLSLFPEEEQVKTSFSEAELEELGQYHDEPNLAGSKI